MPSFSNDVRDFAHLYKLPFFDHNNKPETKDIKLMCDLISEEADEVIDSLQDLDETIRFKDREAGIDEVNEDFARALVAKELCDLLYVTFQAAVRLDINIDGAFTEVHASNMARCVQDDGTVQYAENGKVLKNPNASKPDLKRYV